MPDYTPTTEEVRIKYKLVSGLPEAVANAEFDRWLNAGLDEAQRNIVYNLAAQRILAPSKFDEMFACPADCGLDHEHVARMSGDLYYWSGNE